MARTKGNTLFNKDELYYFSPQNEGGAKTPLPSSTEQISLHGELLAQQGVQTLFDFQKYAIPRLGIPFTSVCIFRRKPNNEGYELLEENVTLMQQEVEDVEVEVSEQIPPPLVPPLYGQNRVPENNAKAVTKLLTQSYNTAQRALEKSGKSEENFLQALREERENTSAHFSQILQTMSEQNEQNHSEMRATIGEINATWAEQFQKKDDETNRLREENDRLRVQQLNDLQKFRDREYEIQIEKERERAEALEIAQQEAEERHRNEQQVLQDRLQSDIQALSDSQNALADNMNNPAGKFDVAKLFETIREYKPIVSEVISAIRDTQQASTPNHHPDSPPLPQRNAPPAPQYGGAFKGRQANGNASVKGAAPNGQAQVSNIHPITPPPAPKLEEDEEFGNEEDVIYMDDTSQEINEG
jgi:hypothetical protein